MSSTPYRPKFGFDIRIKPEAPKRPRSTASRRCAVLGCTEAAELRVPKTRYNMDDRHWLCRRHVRERNESWNFFEGMSGEEVEQHCLDALTGHRPTWPLGKRAAMGQERGEGDGKKAFQNHRFDDGFAVFEDAADPARAPRVSRLTKGQLDALAILNLEDNATLHEIKARYKELVKRFHPDANGGNRGTEERLKQVIKAYGHLRATGLV
jgi:DnaJ domain